MPTKNLCVLVRIWAEGGVSEPLGWFGPPVKYFTDRSKAVRLLWIIFVVSFSFGYAFMHVCLLIHCGHLLGKG